MAAIDFYKATQKNMRFIWLQFFALLVIQAQTQAITINVRHENGLYYIGAPTLTLERKGPSGQRGYKGSFIRMSQAMLKTFNSHREGELTDFISVFEGKYSLNMTISNLGDKLLRRGPAPAFELIGCFILEPDYWKQYFLSISENINKKYTDYHISDSCGVVDLYFKYTA